MNDNNLFFNKEKKAGIDKTSDRLEKFMIKREKKKTKSKLL